MTPEQLKKLAEIAGLKYKEGIFNVKLYLKESGDLYCIFESWRPHESIDQAMMVAEGMIIKDYWLSLSYKTACFIGDYNRPGWYALFRNVAQKRPYDLDASADTPAEAICAAAVAIGG